MDEIERRFKPIDKQLRKYLTDYNKINKDTQDTLQSIFNELDIEYKDLNKRIPQNKKKRLDRRLKELLTKKEDNYMYFILNNALHKRNMTYRDLLEAYIVSAYYEERKTLDEYDNFFFYSVLEEVYNQAITDIEKIGIKKPKIDEIFNWSILYTILNIPLLYGTKDAYLYSLAMTNAEEMYKRVINDMQGSKRLDIDNKNMQELLKKQRNRLILVKDNKYSGAIENMTESYSNLAYLQAGLDNDVRKCRFIAQIDNRTTKMCESLNNQIFYLDDMNVYQRYSEIDGRIVTYHTKGLVIGENLPPIMNHFHWCRSTITYLIDKDVINRYEDITTKWFKKNNKTNNRNTPHYYKKGDVFKYRGNEYTFDDDLIYYDINNNEKDFANWLSERIDKQINVMPKIDVKGGVATPDYIIGKESYDLKTIGKDTYSKQPIYDNIREKYKQSRNFFIDGSFSKYSFEELVEEAQKLFNRKDVSYIDILGIKKGEKFILLRKK